MENVVQETKTPSMGGQLSVENYLTLFNIVLAFLIVMACGSKLRKEQETTISTAANNGNYLSVQKSAGILLVVRALIFHF
jgi:hypothetical protein